MEEFKREKVEGYKCGVCGNKEIERIVYGDEKLKNWRIECKECGYVLDWGEEVGN